MNGVAFVILWVLLSSVSGFAATRLFRRGNPLFIWTVACIGSGAAIYGVIIAVLGSRRML